MKRFILIVMLFSALFTHARPALTCISYRPDPFRDMPLPTMSFTNASLAVVGRTLEQVYTTCATDAGKTPNTIRIIIHPSCSNTFVSVDLKEVSVERALNILTRMYGIENFSTGNCILLSSSAAGLMEHRMYNVLPSAFPDEYTDKSNLNNYFENLGIPFPKGASAAYLPALSKLVLSNTPSNMEILEKVINVINVVPYQTEITFQTVHVSDIDLAEKTMLDMSPTSVATLANESDTVFLMNCIISSGKTCTNSMYSGARGKSYNSSGYAAEFICRPSVNPPGDYIALDVRGTLSLPFEKSPPIHYKLDTSFIVYSGATMLFWLSPPTETESKRATFALIISAHLIDLSGKRLEHQE